MLAVLRKAGSSPKGFVAASCRALELGGVSLITTTPTGGQCFESLLVGDSKSPFWSNDVSIDVQDLDVIVLQRNKKLSDRLLTTNAFSSGGRGGDH